MREENILMIFGNKLKINNTDIWIILFGKHYKVSRNGIRIEKSNIQSKLDKKFTRKIENYIMQYIDKNRSEIEDAMEDSGFLPSSRWHDIDEQIDNIKANMISENSIVIMVKFVYPGELGRLRLMININNLDIVEK